MPIRQGAPLTRTRFTNPRFDDTWMTDAMRRFGGLRMPRRAAAAYGFAPTLTTGVASRSPTIMMSMFCAMLARP